MKLPVVFVLLAAGLEAAVAEEKYFEIGGKLSLKPEPAPTGGITAISWKHEGNFVAEWIKDTVPLTYFGAFKGRTDLNTTTGELTIKSMTKADEGLFTLEVNNEAQAVGYSAKGITHLRDRKVEVVKRPLTCGTNSIHCNLSCLVHAADVGPVEYSWQQDEGPWKELQEENKIINNDEETQRIKTFSCKIKNLISEKDSEPLENPFIKKQNDLGGPVFGIIVLVLLVLGGVALSVFAYKHPQRVSPCLRCVTGHPDQDHAENPPGDGTKGEELLHLRSKTDNGTSIEIPLSEPDETLKDPETVTSNGDPDPDKS